MTQPNFVVANTKLSRLFVLRSINHQIEQHSEKVFQQTNDHLIPVNQLIEKSQEPAVVEQKLSATLMTLISLLTEKKSKHGTISNTRPNNFIRWSREDRNLLDACILLVMTYDIRFANMVVKKFSTREMERKMLKGKRKMIKIGSKLTKSRT